MIRKKLYRQSRFDENQKRIFKTFSNKNVATNIVELAKEYGILCMDVSELAGEVKSVMFLPKSAFNSEIQGLYDYSYFLFFTGNDALSQRMRIAYCIAHVYINNNAEGFNYLKINKYSDEYKTALHLLCPTDKLKGVLKENRITKANFANNTSVLRVAENFLISLEDTENRLNLYFNKRD